MSKHFSVFFLTLSSLLFFCCTNISARNDFVKRDFTKHRVLRAYPASAAPHLTHSKEEGYLISKPAALPSLTTHYYVNVPAGVNSMLYSLTYRASEGAVPRLKANFNKKDGRNGGNGSSRSNFPPSTEWTTHEVLITIPEGTDKIQCIHYASENAYELAIKEASIKFLPDSYTLSKKPENFDESVAPESWNELEEMPGYYRCATAEPATEQTVIKMTFDDEKLYVGMIAKLQAPEKLVANTDDKKMDAAIFNDDCLELFLSSSERSLAWQFAVNANNSRFDAEVKQNMPGDPWKVFRAWNGEWDAYVFRTKDNWQATFVIPWKTLGFSGIPANPLGFNAGRENKIISENSQWNAYDGSFHAVDKYAYLDLKNGKLERSRRSDRATYLIERKNPQFEALLSNQPGNFITASWGWPLIFNFPEKIKQLYSKEEEYEWQETIMKARGEAGTMGIPLPWAPYRYIGGWKKMHELNKEHGMLFPYMIFNSAMKKSAIEAGAKYYIGENGVDPASDGYREYVLNTLENLKGKNYYKDYQDLVGIVFGIDEPTNVVPSIFSLTRNSELADALADADAEIKEKTGFGKYGLYDAFAEPSENVEFERIAFWRWWNQNFARYCKEVKAKLEEVLPGKEFKSINRNTVSGICTVDVALLSPHSDWLSSDPYPTSTSNVYNLGRALYHPGFCSKMLGDLAAKTKLCATPQNFIYHGGRPEPDEIREWVSQCLKAGAEMLYWYTESSDTIINMWEGNLEVYAINKQLKTLPKINLPENTSTAILHSDYDRWGLMDNVLHAAYSLHVIIGEQVQAWFKYVSPTGLALDMHNLDDYKVVYVPRMKFTDQATTAKLMSFVENGGTLVVFDPDFLSFNIDGTTVPERQKLFETKLLERDQREAYLNYEGKKLPIYKVAHLSGPWQGKFQAYDFEKLPRDAKIIARYGDDNKPAAIERPYGKGKVMLFAVQPFGNSAELALQETTWTEFVRTICKDVNEAVDLPIWDFVLKRFPEHKVEINVNKKW